MEEKERDNADKELKKAVIVKNKEEKSLQTLEQWQKRLDLEEKKFITKQDKNNMRAQRFLIWKTLL